VGATLATLNLALLVVQAQTINKPTTLLH